MSTTSIGQLAEAAATHYLQKQGYEIVDRNWRRKTCEVDIIAKKSKVIFIVEVKYRTRDGQGAGLDYITPKKVKQLNFAAELWASENSWTGDIRLLGVSVRADELTPVVEQVVEIS